MNLYREAGELLLGSRLKRISERFLSEVARVYRSSDIDFDPSWFPVFFLLDREGSVTISRFADELLISQSGATQLIKGLEKKGLLEEFQVDGGDRRTKNVRFTDMGFNRLEEVRPVWKALAFSMERLLCEGSNSCRFIPALTELEDEFDRYSLGDRVLEELQRQQLGKLLLLPWNKKHEEARRRLMLEYLSIPEVRFPPKAEEALKHPQQSAGENLLLLSASYAVIGFALLFSRKSGGTEIFLFIDSSWRHCGLENLFINLLEDYSGNSAELTLILNQNQSDFFTAAKKLSYSLLSWEDNLITLRRKT